MKRERQALNAAKRELADFWSGKNRKNDPYILALNLQIAKQKLDQKAKDVRSEFRVIEGGE